MKSPILICVLSLFSIIPAHSKEKPKTLMEWYTIITNDAKLTTLIATLGKPDRKEISNGGLEYTWYGVLDSGTTMPDILRVYVSDYQNQMIVFGIYDPVTHRISRFAWSDKILKQD